MSAKTSVISLIIPLIGSTMPAAAAVAEKQEAGSNLAVWIFLGFCALIIISQLGTLFMGRGSRKASKEADQHSTTQELSKAH